jgi:glutathione S-transferase
MMMVFIYLKVMPFANIFATSTTQRFTLRMSKKRATIEQWIDYASLHIGANFMPIVYNRLFAPLRGIPVNEKAITDGLEFLKQYFPVIEKQLTQHKYIVSEGISLADIVLMALLEPAEMAHIDLSTYPKLTAWRNELKKQSFYTSCYKEYGEMLKTPVSR